MLAISRLTPGENLALHEGPVLDTPAMTRSEKMLALIDVRTQAGVEIGPLTSPVVPRGAGTIYYADHRSTEELRSKYREHGRLGLVDLESIVPINLVLAERTLEEALGVRAPIDYVLASHVIEHLPDPIGWLQMIARCLREGGVLSLAVPDKRFTFDHYRQCTSTRELVEWHLRGERHPTPGQVFDHLANAAKVDAAKAWRGELGARVPLEGHTLPAGFGLAREVALRPAYHDVHCTVFTPCTFARTLRDFFELDLLPYEVARFVPTERLDAEFFATLRKRTDVPRETRIASVPTLAVGLHDAVPSGPSK